MQDTINILYPAVPAQQDPPLQLGPPDAAGGGEGAGLQPPAEIPPGMRYRQSFRSFAQINLFK